MTSTAIMVERAIQRNRYQGILGLLRDERVTRGISVESIAEKLNKSPGYIYQLESGHKSDPKISLIEQYAEAVGVSLLEILLRSELIDSLKNKQFSISRKKLGKLAEELSTVLEEMEVLEKKYSS